MNAILRRLASLAAARKWTIRRKRPAVSRVGQLAPAAAATGHVAAAAATGHVAAAARPAGRLAAAARAAATPIRFAAATSAAIRSQQEHCREKADRTLQHHAALEQTTCHSGTHEVRGKWKLGAVPACAT